MADTCRARSARGHGSSRRASRSPSASATSTSSRCMSVRESLDVPRRAGAQRHRAPHRRPRDQGDRRAPRASSNDVGVGYLTLHRAAATLSGGEAQRIRLATQIGSALVGVLYILDEPSIGLHQRDNRRLIDTLLRLRDLGNTVIVVEHDEETMRAADHIVDMGPGAGEHGGRVVAQGTPAGGHGRRRTRSPASILAGRRRIALPGQRRLPLQWFTVRGARMHNLKDIDVAFPLGRLHLRHRRLRLRQVHAGQRDPLQGPGGAPQPRHQAARRRARRHRRRRARSTRSSTSTSRPSAARRAATRPPTPGVFDHIRELFAQTPESKLRGYKPGRFSFNVKGGRCEACKGDGQIKIEMHFLPDVYVPCEVCHGKRYNRETLEVRYKGKNIAEVLEMSVEEARRVLRQRAAHRAAPQDARRGRPRLRQARPAGDHALRRRGPAGQARRAS